MTRFRDTGHTLVTTKQTIRLTQTKAEGKSTYTLGLHPAYAVLEELLKNRQYLAFIEATEQPTNVTIEEPDLNAIVPNKGFVSLTAASEMPIVYPNGVANIISLISMMPEDEDKEKFLKASIIRALIDFHIKSHTKKVNDFALYVLRPHCTSGSLDPIMLPWVREFLRVTEPNTEQTLAWYLWYMNCPILGFDHRRELMLR